MRVIHYIGLCAALLSAPTLARADAPPEPAVHPDWSEVGGAGIQIIKNSLVDPDSVAIEWVSGFKWGYRKPVIGKRTFGWLACGNYNARSRLGGYVGPRGFLILHTEEGETSVYQYGDGTSTCHRGAAPVDPELIALTSGEPKPAIGVADELNKLADLLDRGIISASEFEEQKGKLLAR